MQPAIKSDFVPDKPIGGGRKTTAKIPQIKTGGPDFLVVFAVIVLIINIALAIGVSAYKSTRSSALEEYKTTLIQAKEKEKYDSIRILARLDKRLKAANSLLEKHLAPSLVLRLFEEYTLSSIYYKKFSYTNLPGEQIKVSVSGVAESVNSIALQADIFAKNRAIIDPVFSNLAFSRDGVSFQLAMIIDRVSILYSNLINQSVNDNN